MLNRQQIPDKWTSTGKEHYTYNYTVVLIDDKVVRVFNSHRQAISPNSEVMAYFMEKYGTTK